MHEFNIGYSFSQGNQVLKNFDINKEAGGVPRRAVKRDFTALVTENYIDVHFFWAGKGTCCVPSQGDYGPLISAISATPSKSSALLLCTQFSIYFFSA